LKVKLLDHTEQPDILAATAARSCRSSKGADEIMKTEDESRLRKVLRTTIEKGHTSVIEHVKFTFGIEGISRSCSHQLVRHRIASYSQQSQRHINPEEEKFVIPHSVEEDPSALKKYEEAMEKAWEAYEKLGEAGVPKEDARFVLPNATRTNIVVTMNARSLINFFEQRTCMHAQWEIKALANKMLSKVRSVAPTIFEDAGPPCKRRGICPEDDSSCELYETFVVS